MDNSISLWRKKKISFSHNKRDPVFQIWRCCHCGAGFLNPAPHPDLLNEVYKYSGHALLKPITLNAVLTTEKKCPNSTIDSVRIARNVRILDSSGINKALDIGSGYGFYTASLRNMGYKTISINPGQYENAVFEALTGGYPLPVMFEDYKTNSKFGVILMSQVLEHIVNPNKSVYKVSKLLSPGGIFACAVPNFGAINVKILKTKDNACLWLPEHVNFFTLKGISILLESHGLQIVKSEQITRIRYDALSRRLPWGVGKNFLNGLVQYGQIPLRRIVNKLRMGIYINIYARKVRT